MKKDTQDQLITIVDVGALGGIHKKWENVPNKAILFEPNPSAKFEKRDNWLVIEGFIL